jgi:lysophospholipase L1-like esterase
VLPADTIATMTTHGSVRGRFQSDPVLPYVLAPSFSEHNSLGLRGPEVTREKPSGVCRIVCVGSSTTYGIPHRPPYAYPARLDQLLQGERVRCQVLNAGVPGWVLTECLVDLEHRILGLHPDVVIVYEGRNEVCPQCFNNFAADYSHYRRSDYDARSSNYWHKPAFRLSNLAMVLCTYNGQRFGWSDREENPAYGCIRFDNQPTSAEVVTNLGDPRRGETFAVAVDSLISRCRAADVPIVFGTMAFRPEKFVSGNLRMDPAIHDALAQQVRRNNQTVRRICAARGVPVAETAVLADDPELFVDDCHLTRQGYERLAALFHQTLRDAELVH